MIRPGDDLSALDYGGAFYMGSYRLVAESVAFYLGLIPIPGSWMPQVFSVNRTSGQVLDFDDKGFVSRQD